MTKLDKMGWNMISQDLKNDQFMHKIYFNFDLSSNKIGKDDKCFSQRNNMW